MEEEVKELQMEEKPFNLGEILSDLEGVGVVELQKPIELTSRSGRPVSFTLSNVSTQKEIDSLMAAEEFKGHHWIQRIKAEILSRALTTLNGTYLNTLENPYVKDVDGKEVHVRTALRDLMISWGPETLTTVWKIYMVHCQNIEDRLLQSFPDTMTITEYEKNFYSRAADIVEEFAKDLAREVIADSETEESPEE